MPRSKATISLPEITRWSELALKRIEPDTTWTVIWTLCMVLTEVSALFEHHEQDVQSSIFYETYGLTISRFPFCGALKMRNLVSNLDCYHSAHRWAKDLFVMAR